MRKIILILLCSLCSLYSIARNNEIDTKIDTTYIIITDKTLTEIANVSVNQLVMDDMSNGAKIMYNDLKDVVSDIYTTVKDDIHEQTPKTYHEIKNQIVNYFNLTID
jgi:hypothetical protein